jgi:hypothetical protein
MGESQPLRSKNSSKEPQSSLMDLCADFHANARRCGTEMWSPEH